MARATKNTKVAKNTKSVKENKTMTKKANITLNLTGTVEELNALSAYLKEQGIKAEKQGKATEVGKKTASKTATKNVTKSNAPKDFDRERYESIGEQLGVLGKHGVHKFARNTVYKAMKEAELTEEMLDKYEQELIDIATKEKLTWFLEKQENAEVEIEEDEEVAI